MRLDTEVLTVCSHWLMLGWLSRRSCSAAKGSGGPRLGTPGYRGLYDGLLPFKYPPGAMGLPEKMGSEETGGMELGAG